MKREEGNSNRSTLFLLEGSRSQPPSNSLLLAFLFSGHARVYCAADVLFRFLRRSGHSVRYVRNFTDIDDKIIARAKESGGAADGEGAESAPSDIAGACSVLTEKFIDEFHDDVDALRCLRPTSEPRATAFVRFLWCFFLRESRRENSRAEERKKKQTKTQTRFLRRLFHFRNGKKKLFNDRSQK